MKYLELAKQSIENFSVEKSDYFSATKNASFTLTNNTSNNAIYVKEEKCHANIHVNYNHCVDCNIYIGKNLKGDISVNFNGDNATLYIGDNCDLKQLQIRSRQHNDFVAIGEEVSIAGNSIWVSGYGAGNSTPAIIVGDDCMFSFDVTIRNSDAHPIFSTRTDLQINEPTGLVHLEPHVWVGEHASILKDTTVGACSIIALGSTVTKDVSRFSTAMGVPARATQLSDAYWARDHSDFAVKQAKYYMKKYSQD